MSFAIQRIPLRTLVASSGLIGLWIATGCAHAPSMVQPTPQALPQLHGSSYQVQPGETLWRIARAFGLDVKALAVANRLPDPSQVKVGQLLFIPAPPESDRFLWPAIGRVRRVRGSMGSANRGLEIKASEGSFVRASRSGRVAVATHQLAGWGKTVLLDHGGGYVTVYTGLEQLLVSPGGEVRQGSPLGRLGRAPLYFEIRRGIHPSDPLRVLP